MMMEENKNMHGVEGESSPGYKEYIQSSLEELKQAKQAHEKVHGTKRVPRLQEYRGELVGARVKNSKLLTAGLILVGIIIVIGLAIPLVLIGSCFYLLSGSI